VDGETVTEHRDYATDYDMNSPKLAEEWDGVIADLHGRCPMARSEVGEGYWIAIKQDDIKKATQDWETFSSATGFMPDRPAEMPWLWPVESDPPVHTHLRSALNQFLSPGVVRTYKGAVRQHGLDLLAEFDGEEVVDVVPRFGNALPGRSFCVTVAGMGTKDIVYLQKKFEIGILGAIEERGQAMQDAGVRIGEYLERRSKEPARGDLIDAILALDFEGCGWEEKVNVLMTLTLGGIGTTGYVIAASLHWLAQNPEERKRLVADPSLMPTAVEEFLRFFAASPHDGRRVTCPVTMGGVELDKGDYVIMNYGAASRDPEVFENPHEVDIARPLPNKHMSFGYGIHRCIGSHLARLEVVEALSTFLERYPDFELEEGFTPTYQINNTVLMESLPLVLR
jgi:cytochrome P450